MKSPELRVDPSCVRTYGENLRFFAPEMSPKSVRLETHIAKDYAPRR